MATIIQIRRDTAANWSSENPILAVGEKGIVINGSGVFQNQYKIGDGATAWNSLTLVDLTNIDLTDHLADTSNPHDVTKAQIGLTKVDDTSDADKPVSTAQAAADALTKPVPSALSDGATISLDLNSKYFELKTLTTTTTEITLTLSNVVAGASQILSINKNTASDVVITLAGSGLTFYGYTSADYNTTPEITLSGASGNIYDLSFLARTATEIGVATGLNGN